MRSTARARTDRRTHAACTLTVRGALFDAIIIDTLATLCALRKADATLRNEFALGAGGWRLSRSPACAHGTEFLGELASKCWMCNSDNPISIVTAAQHQRERWQAHLAERALLVHLVYG